MAISTVEKPKSDEAIAQLTINTIRTLSIDAIQKAKSGHPGTPMALAPLVYTLWNRVMQFDPKDPIWPNRDRFVLSNGHASMLLWSILHLTGTQAVDAEYENLGKPSVSLDDIRRFRQIDSRAPGHPEYHWVSGVETTTGPLGQGIATGVGMAIAEKWLANRYNKPGYDIFGYNIYAICGDGCLMEGVASEAASLAAHLGLDNFCWIYDNNHITIEGDTNITFTEDVAARFLAYGWNVVRVGDANDVGRIERAIRTFQQTQGRPTLIILDSHIGYGLRTNRILRKLTVNRWGMRKSNSPSAPTDGRRTLSFSSPRACPSIWLPASARAAPRPGRNGWTSLRPIARNIRRSPPRSTRCRSASFPWDGTRTSRSSRPTRKASPAARPPVRS